MRKLKNPLDLRKVEYDWNEKVKYYLYRTKKKGSHLKPYRLEWVGESLDEAIKQAKKRRVKIILPFVTPKKVREKIKKENLSYVQEKKGKEKREKRRREQKGLKEY